jgi:hypothetical protein
MEICETRLGETSPFGIYPFVNLCDLREYLKYFGKSLLYLYTKNRNSGNVFGIPCDHLLFLMAIWYIL